MTTIREFKKHEKSHYYVFQEARVKSAGASFSPDSRRATVFAGLTFLFSTQNQMTRMCKPIHLAGKLLFLTMRM